MLFRPRSGGMPSLCLSSPIATWMTGVVLLSCIVVLTTLANTAGASSPGNPLGIDYDPAPPPDRGPPLSKGALRNRKLLPYEVCGIVGAYVITVAFLGLLLLLIGRRLRKQAGISYKLDVEMVTQAPVVTQMPQKSPSWSIRRPWQSPKSPRSPMSQTATSFDEQVLEEDKKKRAIEMERLYAAVMEHDDERHGKSPSITAENTPEDAITPATPNQPELDKKVAPSSPRQQKSPGIPRISMPHMPRFSLPRSPRSPKSPRSPGQISQAESKHSRTGSIASSGSKGRRGIRGLPISNPIQIPSYTQFIQQHPTSPRSPRSGRSGRQGSYLNSPTSARRDSDEEPLSPNFPPGYDSNTPTGASSTGEITPGVGRSRTIPEQDGRSFTSSRPSPSLPLRNKSSTAGSDSRTKVTVLERTIAKPSTTKTPRTGVPMTPYSPYMPFTPITPVTPRLVTRQERKMREKEEARMVREMAKSEKELFDSAY